MAGGEDTEGTGRRGDRNALERYGDVVDVVGQEQAIWTPMCCPARKKQLR